MWKMQEDFYWLELHNTNILKTEAAEHIALGAALDARIDMMVSPAGLEGEPMLNKPRTKSKGELINLDA